MAQNRNKMKKSSRRRDKNKVANYGAKIFFEVKYVNQVKSFYKFSGIAFKNNDKLPQKIIYASTISVYGERIDQEYYNEDLLPRPFSPYAKSKYKAENFLLKYYKNKTWILRLAPVYSKDFLLNINRRTKIGLLNYKVGYGNKKLSLCNIKNIVISFFSSIFRNNLLD